MEAFPNLGWLASHHLPGLQLGLGVAIIGTVIVQIYALVVYRGDQEFLKRFLNKIVSSDVPPSEQVQSILKYLHTKPETENNQFLFVPVFRFLRPTPRQIAEWGADCSDRCRLIIVLLGIRGIRAAKWAIYSPAMVPCHAVVEVHTESGLMVVDPLFDLWFPNPGGGFYGVEDLRNDPQILNQRIQDLLSNGGANGVGNLRFYPLDKYVFTYARSINWDKSPVFSLLYSLLYRLLGQRINEASRPAWSEQPALMILYMGFIVELLCLAVGLSQ